jgi:hypothetical protein
MGISIMVFSLCPNEFFAPRSHHRRLTHFCRALRGKDRAYDLQGMAREASTWTGHR